ncbi:TetR/AcrR family transcriptional regulator [Massilia niabensis]|uniref:TetR/AcrR family transcriptional regulator n=1 Tax=Massilia niabensis TaxID=544910 RepID=A0ABW0L279_9BURK
MDHTPKPVRKARPAVKQASSAALSDSAVAAPQPAKPSNIARRRQAALTEGGVEYTAKRRELVELAVRVFKDKGFKATTLNDISKAANIDRATLYYYVASKEELLQEAVQDMLKNNLEEADRIMRRDELDQRGKLTLLFKMLMVSYEQNYPHMYVYIQELMHEVPHDSSPWAKQMLKQTRRFEKMTMTLIAQGIDEGVFRPDVSVHVATNGLFGMFNWTHRWFKPSGKLSAEDVAEQFCKIFLDGITLRTA